MLVYKSVSQKCGTAVHAHSISQLYRAEDGVGCTREIPVGVLTKVEQLRMVRATRKVTGWESLIELGNPMNTPRELMRGPGTDSSSATVERGLTRRHRISTIVRRTLFSAPVNRYRCPTGE